jgi:hypothetical protein
MDQRTVDVALVLGFAGELVEHGGDVPQSGAKGVEPTTTLILPLQCPLDPESGFVARHEPIRVDRVSDKFSATTAVERPRAMRTR